MNILVAVVCGFASGVFLRSLFVLHWPVLAFTLLLALICAGAAVLTPRRLYTLSALFLVLAALGGVRASFADRPLPKIFAADLRHRVTYEGVVTNDPDLRDANQRAEVRVQKGHVQTKVLVVVPRTTLLAVGDTVSVTGTLLTPQPFSDEGGRVFRYDKYLERDGVRFIMNFAFARVEKPAPWYSVPAALAQIKHAFLGGLARALPEPYASLAGGIVIGGKSGLGTELQNAFVRSGLVQIIVLSGYNVMVVAEWVMIGLGRTRVSKRYAALAGALALLFFVGIAGFSATALRASLMALIALFARATNRSYAASRALLVAVFLMLVWNPLFLVFDPGFGLSVAATAGLIWLAPGIEARLSLIKNGFWKNAVATTLAAQTAVLPLLLYDTGNLSFVAIPANLLVMPFVPLAMGFSAVAGVAGMLFGTIAPLIATLVAFPAYILTGFLIAVARTSAALPGAALVLPAFPFWFVPLTYAALAAAASKRFSITSQLRFAKKASM